MKNFFVKKGVIVDKRYYKYNLELALPIILANAGQSLVAIVDNIMVGQLGTVPLAAASLAGIIVTNVLVFGLGIAISLTPIVGQLYAKRDYRKSAIFFENSISLNLIVGVSVAILLSCMTPILSYIGQPDDVVELAKPFFLLLAISIIPYMLFLSFKQFMEGIGNTKVSMVITIACNLLNILLNYMFIYGKFGAPDMGAVGAAVATLIARALMPVAFVAYMFSTTKYKRFFYFFNRAHLRIRKHIQLLKVGAPISGQMVIEMFALTMTTVMMGWISAEAMAASQIVLSVISFMFMVTTGISGAVTILVSHEFGHKNKTEIANYSKAGIVIAACFMTFAAFIFWVFSSQIAQIFNSDPVVIKMASNLFVLAIFLEIADGVQVTTLGALRGLQDVTRPMIYAALIYTCINIPVAYILGFVFDLGAIGIWCGFIVSIMIITVLFIRRLRTKIRQLDF